MNREVRLLLRLERREKHVHEEQEELVEDQRGFLLELGWKQVVTYMELWIDPQGQSDRGMRLEDALSKARLRIREAHG